LMAAYGIGGGEDSSYSLIPWMQQGPCRAKDPKKSALSSSDFPDHDRIQRAFRALGKHLSVGEEHSMIKQLLSPMARAKSFVSRVETAVSTSVGYGKMHQAMFKDFSERSLLLQGRALAQ